ncbi:TPA: hypothetical protein ACLGZT_005062, partial [Salmonella enterica]
NKKLSFIVIFYNNRFLFTERSEKRCPGSASLALARSGSQAQYVASFPAVSDTTCCVTSLHRDPARRAGKDRFAYSVRVAHFRKIVISQKTGSYRIGDTVI